MITCPGQITLRDSERALILQTLEAAGWVVAGPQGAAAKLGLKRTTLMAKMQKHGIFRPPRERYIDHAVEADSRVTESGDRIN